MRSSTCSWWTTDAHPPLPPLYRNETLVLGAWGCGAFGNDPLRTARDFRSALEGAYAGGFREVVFAITDWSDERRFLGPFRDVFAP
jgi:uncharacterized protein (TIGR02452 family)